MDLTDLELFAEAATDLFRLETLPTYCVPAEVEEFAAWKRGSRVVPAVNDSPWLKQIRDTTASGVRWWRVRILDYPLTDYSAFELHSYQGNAAAGESIFVANRAWSTDLADLHDDFWMFDDKTTIRMIYDDEGRFIRPELAKDIARYQSIRSTAARHAVILTDYLANNEPQLLTPPRPRS